jgi:hypothetical protein
MDAYYDNTANWSGIPHHMRGAIERYVMHGAPMGDFLRAIFANDFMEAAGRADDENQHALLAYARFLYNHVPATCKGSYEAVDAWMAQGGLVGRHPAPEAAALSVGVA